MFRPYTQDQMMLLPPSLKDLIEENHPVYLIDDLVEKLEMGVLERRYGNIGQPAYHPRLMLKVILYGFTVGIFSARKLMRACQENVAFQFLSGGEKPAFKTIIDFRKRHLEDMKEVFVQTVKLAQELGLKKLGNVALDGTKIQANTSRHKAMSHGRMEKEEQRLQDEIVGLLKKADDVDAQEDRDLGKDNDGYSLQDQLAHRQERLKKIEAAKAALEAREKKENPDKPIDSKKQISFADTEARCFSNTSNGTAYVYNAQAAIDMETQIIVENHIEDTTSDAEAARTALTNMKQDLGQTPGCLVADSAYGNVTTMDACREHKVMPVCATRQESGKLTEAREQGKTPASFIYDEKANTFECLHGQVFKFSHWTDNGNQALYYSTVSSRCTCQLTRLKKNGLQKLRIRKSHLIQRELQRIMRIPANEALYGKRKVTIEPVFGQIKSGMGFRRCFYRGREKVRSEWNVVCAAFNLKKIAALINRDVLKPIKKSSLSLLEKESAADSSVSPRIALGVRLFFNGVLQTNTLVAPFTQGG